MSNLKPWDHITIDDYLAGERDGEIRHEYVDGQVFAMAGASERHNRVAGNLFFLFRAAARGGNCGVFMSDMKVHVRDTHCFYYPDLLLTCDPADDEPYFKQRPCLIAEVLSPSTASTDRREKWNVYRRLPSLRYYLLVSADERRVEYFRRNLAGAWETALLEDGEVLEVLCSGYHARLTLAEIYEDVKLPIGVEEEAARYG